VLASRSAHSAIVSSGCFANGTDAGNASSHARAMAREYEARSYLSFGVRFGLAFRLRAFRFM
jgi:hypothetical protein